MATLAPRREFVSVFMFAPSAFCFSLCLSAFVAIDYAFAFIIDSILSAPIPLFLPASRGLGLGMRHLLARLRRGVLFCLNAFV
jgi:hypothetical protein